MTQLACRDRSYCVSSVFYASTSLSAGASLGTINPNKTTSPKCCVLPQLRCFSDHSKVNVTAGDSKQAPARRALDGKLITAVEMLGKASLSETLIKFQESIDLSRSQRCQITAVTRTT